MRLSQADLATFLDVSRAAVSQATKNQHKCGGYPISAWAVYDGAGRVTGYDVPDHIVKDRKREEPSSDASSAPLVASPTSQAQPTEAASALLDEEQIREILHTELQRQNPTERDSRSENRSNERREDYMRPASVGGLSYVMAKAIDGDSGTARAAVISAGTLFGGLVGHEVSKHWAGALAGALLIGGLGWKAMQSGPASGSSGAVQPSATTNVQSPNVSDGARADEEDDPFALNGPIRAVGT